MTGDSAEEKQGESGAGAADSFDALLKQAARVSMPVAAGSRALPVGSTLAGGRLSILKRLGEGGMGVVYEAFDAQRRQRVALKTLSRIDPSGVYRLKAEFRALADVTHDHLVRLHELFSDDGLWFFTMDLVDGVRFDEWVRPGGELDAARLRAALAQLTDAVSAVHAAG
ncbi:MAG: protein kinase, partial [Polyangiales bacterium]